MNTEEQQDPALQDALNRFEEFVDATIASWPREDTPLSRADFSAARYEILTLLNRTRDGRKDAPPVGRQNPAAAQGASGSDPETEGQYLPVTPAPWP